MPFWKSTDQGASFVRCPTIGTNIASSDYPWIAVDDWEGSGQHDVYVVISGSVTNSSRLQWLSVSTDGQASNWSEPRSIGGGQMPQMVVGPDHVTYLAWRRWISGSSYALVTCAVSNRGSSISTNRTICGLRISDHPVHLFRDNVSTNADDWFKAFVYPALAVNPSTSRSNHLYIGFLDQSTNTNDRADVFFTKSSDGGVTWASPLRVNLDGGTNDQWMPSVAVRPDGNMLCVSWLDRRNDTNNSLIDVYGRWARIATNGTVSFFTNDFRITAGSFPPAYGGALTVNTNIGYYDPVWPTFGVNLHWFYDWWYEPDQYDEFRTGETYAHETGEHNGAYASDGHVYSVWADNRGASRATAYPPRRQADIRLSRLRWPAP